MKKNILVNKNKGLKSTISKDIKSSRSKNYQSIKSSDEILLGKETNYDFFEPNLNILQGIKNPHCDIDYVVRFSCPEFTSLCPITSQPDFAHLVIDYIPNKKIIESKSLKLYLFSYRNHGAFHEDCSIQIAKDLMKICQPKWLRLSGYWFPRGGIPIDIFFQSSQKPKNIYINNNLSYNYKAR